MNDQPELNLYAVSAQELRRRRMPDRWMWLRVHNREHARAGRPVYHPRLTMAAVIDVLRAAGPEWTGFMDLCDQLDVPTDGLSLTLDRLIRLGVAEQKPLYYGADPTTPELPPVPYRGFQFGYRLKQSPT